jgi:hypothetical protein
MDHTCHQHVEVQNWHGVAHHFWNMHEDHYRKYKLILQFNAVLFIFLNGSSYAFHFDLVRLL